MIKKINTASVSKKTKIVCMKKIDCIENKELKEKQTMSALLGSIKKPLDNFYEQLIGYITEILYEYDVVMDDKICNSIVSSRCVIGGDYRELCPNLVKGVEIFCTKKLTINGILEDKEFHEVDIYKYIIPRNNNACNIIITGGCVIGGDYRKLCNNPPNIGDALQHLAAEANDELNAQSLSIYRPNAQSAADFSPSEFSGPAIISTAGALVNYNNVFFKVIVVFSLIIIYKYNKILLSYFFEQLRHVSREFPAAIAALNTQELAIAELNAQQLAIEDFNANKNTKYPRDSIESISTAASGSRRASFGSQGSDYPDTSYSTDHFEANPPNRGVSAMPKTPTAKKKGISRSVTGKEKGLRPTTSNDSFVNLDSQPNQDPGHPFEGKIRDVSDVLEESSSESLTSRSASGSGDSFQGYPSLDAAELPGEFNSDPSLVASLSQKSPPETPATPVAVPRSTESSAASASQQPLVPESAPDIAGLTQTLSAESSTPAGTSSPVTGTSNVSAERLRLRAIVSRYLK